MCSKRPEGKGRRDTSLFLFVHYAISPCDSKPSSFPLGCSDFSVVMLPSSSHPKSSYAEGW